MDINITYYPNLHLLKHKLKVKELPFYCWSEIHSHSRIFENEHNSFPKLSVNITLYICG